MNRITKTISIRSIEEIPTLESIRETPSEQKLKLIFGKSLENQREAIGQKLKKELIGFQVGVHTIDPEINIAKLITDQEIEEHQDFFEQCAKDYRQLGEELLFKLVEKLGLSLNQDFPMETFGELKRNRRSIGKVEEWRYHVHGFHCGFENTKTKQVIEVPLVFGLEFGDLDSYFFMRYIKSTPNYKPLPVNIFEDYTDGAQIIKKMVSLGKFERISSNVDNHFGVAVTDRQKVEIKSYIDLNKSYEEQSKQQVPKFDFWRFIGFKK